jgi:hypothetical protein
MPYKVFKSGNQWCVHKETSDGGKGEKIGCHDSESSAKKQLRALYANEGKEALMPDENLNSEQETKERLEKGYVPWGVTSFSDLKDAREAAEAAEKTYDLMTDYTGIVSNILSDSSVEDKASAVQSVTGELQTMLKSGHKEEEEKKELEPVETNISEDSLVDKIVKGIKSFFIQEESTDEDEQNDFMLWKEADGTMRWLATYSNKFRDDDRPVPEIISEKSHIKFEELVDTKQVSMPELWLWHVPEWKFGVADWIAWDTEGFALASGTIDRDKESVAEWISEQKDVAVSHGMPKDSIVRDPDDPSIIVGHVTREISPLPISAAANKRTDFLIIGNEQTTKMEDVMAISSEKKQKLQENWNAPEGLLERLESANSEKAKDAVEDGVEFKETETEVVDETPTEEGAASETESEPTEQAEAETQPEAEESETQDSDSTDMQTEHPTREEVVDALTPMAKQIEALEGQVSLLIDAVKEIVSDDEQKIASKASEAPPASIAAMIAKNMTAIGSEETEVKEGDDLANDKPKEADAEGITRYDFINNILQQQQ